MKKLPTLIFLASLPIGTCQAVIFAPTSIDNTFFTRDVIFGDSTAVGAPGAVSNFGSRQFFETGIAASGGGSLANGLNPNGLHTLTSGSDTYNFQLQDDSVNNIHVFHGGNPNRSATLTTPIQTETLSFLLANASAGSGSLNYTVNYDSGPTTVGSIASIPNWGGAGPNALFNVARTTANISNWNGLSDNNPIWSFFHFEVSTDPLRSVQSVDFSLGNGQIGLMGVAAAVPEPSSAALLGLGGLALILRRRK